MTKPKLLLADDSVTIRKVVELTFADEGIEVFAVGDGDAAMLKFVEVQPDIVLVDVEMPGPTGYQICEMIKQDDVTRHIPVLLLVGSFEPFDHDLAERSGADGFLTKPFHSIRDLVARVSDLLDTGSVLLAAGPEIDDIEELYSSSFAETIPIQDYDTEEDPFSDPGVEGNESDVIESIQEAQASHEAPEPARMTDAPFSGHEDPFSDPALDDQIIETISHRRVDSFLNEIPDDEMIEAFRPAGAIESEKETDTGPDADDPAALVKDFDWSPAAKVVDEPEAVQDASGFEPRFVFTETETVEADSVAERENTRPPIEENLVNEPSEEMIALLAKRVVESLSDRVIREIAQDAVPRIAEKLIREALEEENKR